MTFFKVLVTYLNNKGESTVQSLTVTADNTLGAILSAAEFARAAGATEVVSLTASPEDIEF